MLNRRIILDKNFLQAENSHTPRLHALSRQGCSLILSDTLIYEICSDQRKDFWWSVQKKLARFADQVLVCHHSSELVRQEVSHDKPVESPIDVQSTMQLRAILKSGVLNDGHKQSDALEQTRKERIATYSKIPEMARSFGKFLAGCKPESVRASKENLRDIVRFNLNEPKLINWVLKSGQYPEHILRNVKSGWFLYQQARLTLALIAVYLGKYGLNESAPSSFANTKYDLEYVCLLQYFEGIASDEKRDMAQLFDWLWGSEKKYVTSEKLLTINPTNEQISLEAYLCWINRGRRHGFDVEDWFETESRLWFNSWELL